MNPREFVAKRKVHLTFGGIFLIALLLNITIIHTGIMIMKKTAIKKPYLL